MRRNYIVFPLIEAIWLVALCDAKKFCHELYHKGVLELDVNPAFLNVDDYDTEDGDKRKGLTISSFYHHTFTYDEVTGVYVPDQPPFAPDQLGRVAKIDDIKPDLFGFQTYYEKLTSEPNTTWPNDARRIPDGMLSFEGVIIPQGFHSIPTAGRLTIVDVAIRKEYIVHESTLDFSPPVYEEPNDMPKFFHMVLFYDMDGDDKLDIVTVRSGFKVLPGQQGSPIVYPPYSELVYYKNPGDDIDPDVKWEEQILYGGHLARPPFMGPDINLAMHDFDGDGVPEIVATHFFSGDNSDDDPSGDPRMPQLLTKGKIAMYGAPFGGSGNDVDGNNPLAQPRVKVLDNSEGFPFSIDIVDLNGDGTMEILATNH